MSVALDIFDPTTYPTRRDEAWRYSDLKRHLRKDPEAQATNPLWESLADGFSEVKTHCDGRKLSLLGFHQQQNLHLKSGQKQVLVHYLSGHNAYAAQTVLDIDLPEGAELLLLILADEPESATHIYQTTVSVASKARFSQCVLTVGAGLQRFETEVTHLGEGANVQLNGAYLLKEKAHTDFTTVVNHKGRDGKTTQDVRGLVKDTATGVFQGRFSVAKGADGTDAKMYHGAIILNDGAKVRAKPELEIYADDVSCAHGNTVGALDEGALFFCQTRGMDELTARKLLTEAFVRPVVDKIEDERAQVLAEAWLSRISEGYYGV